MCAWLYPLSPRGQTVWEVVNTLARTNTGKFRHQFVIHHLFIVIHTCVCGSTEPRSRKQGLLPLWHFRNCNLTSESPQIFTRWPQTPDKAIGTLCCRCGTEEVLRRWDGTFVLAVSVVSSQCSGKIEGSQTCVIYIVYIILKPKNPLVLHFQLRTMNARYLGFRWRMQAQGPQKRSPLGTLLNWFPGVVRPLLGPALSYKVQSNQESTLHQRTQQVRGEYVFNRPGVARAVLQSPLLLIN